jgi:thermostable 8-oxoguanine DNA glycosylase
MASRAGPDRILARLLKRGLVGKEDPATAALVHELRHVKRARRFSRPEFLRMCRWKSPRAVHQYERNAAATIRATSRAVLGSRSERRRLELLTTLKGVSVPTASAILTLIDPRHYGVIDIRVWQLLFRIGAVGSKPGGTGFRYADWELYLAILRRHASALRVSVRHVELTLFEHHRRTHKGRLYLGR